MRKDDSIVAEPRIYTTHNRDGVKPKLIAKPVIVNGMRALGFEKNGIISNYIPYDEVNRAMYASDLPERELDF